MFLHCFVSLFDHNPTPSSHSFSDRFWPFWNHANPTKHIIDTFITQRIFSDISINISEYIYSMYFLHAICVWFNFQRECYTHCNRLSLSICTDNSSILQMWRNRKWSKTYHGSLLWWAFWGSWQIREAIKSKGFFCEYMYTCACNNL